MSETLAERHKEWAKAFIEAGHSFTKDEDGEPDFFAVCYEHHNGPACEKCGWECCHHCTPAANIPTCKGRTPE
jgi:hypothetical protein